MACLGLPSRSHDRTGMRGHIQLHSAWDSRLYIGKLTDPDRTRWEDSIAIGEDGYFEYVFTADQSRCRIIRLAALPKSSGGYTFLEGREENTINLVVPDTGWIELEARIDQLFYSFHLLSGPDNIELEALRDLKIPFLHFLEDNPYDSSSGVTKFIKEAQWASLDKLIEQYKVGILHYLNGTNDSPLLLIGLYDYYRSNRGRADPKVFRPILQRITDTAIPLYGQFQQRVNFVIGMEGSVAFPDPPFLNPQGQQVRCSDYKANYIVIDFWASWCLPCRKAIKVELPVLQQRYSVCGVIFIGLSLDKQEHSWLRVLQTDSPFWPQFREGPYSLSRQWGINAIPYYVVLDQAYRVVFHTGLSEEVEAFLKNACLP